MERYSIDSFILDERELAEHYKESGNEDGYKGKSKLVEFLEELKSYKKAEENGMLIHLPCRVGDTVYCLTSERTKVVECKVLWIEIHGNGVMVFSLDGGLGDVVLAHLGKTWFLTSEEAEQALAKMKGGVNDANTSNYKKE